MIVHSTKENIRGPGVTQNAVSGRRSPVRPPAFAPFLSLSISFCPGFGGSDEGLRTKDEGLLHLDFRDVYSESMFVHPSDFKSDANSDSVYRSAWTPPRRR